MQLHYEHDPILKTPCEPFDFENPQVDPEKLFNDMADAMCDFNGIGLAAPQIGMLLNVFVMGDPQTREEVMAVFNPRIVFKSDQLVYYEEGCLSFPGLYVKIKRPNMIRARYATAEGIINTIKFGGMTARIFQHEYDHLQGIRMIDIAHKMHLEKARKWKKKMDRRKK